MDKPKLICPHCGLEMNQHAMKVDYNVEDPALIDPAYGGVVEEVHECPNGHAGLRQA